MKTVEFKFTLLRSTFQYIKSVVIVIRFGNICKKKEIGQGIKFSMNEKKSALMGGYFKNFFNAISNLFCSINVST